MRLARARWGPQVDVARRGQTVEHLALVRRQFLGVFSPLALQRFDEAGAVGADSPSRRVPGAPIVGAAQYGISYR